MKIHIFDKFDYIILLCIFFLTFMGIAFIYSSGINSDGILTSREYLKQIMWMGIGLGVLVIAAFFDFRHLKRYSFGLYLFIIAVLIYTMLFGKYVKGARSWIGIRNLGIQPSEPCKIIYILFLALYLERTPHEKPLKRFIYALTIMLIPMGLILLQPDLGTATVYLPIFIFMCFMANVPVRYLGLVLGIGMGTIVCTVLPIWELAIIKGSVPLVRILTDNKLKMTVILATGMISGIGILGQVIFKQKYFYWIAYLFAILFVSLLLSIPAGKVLRPYQIQRLIVFLDPQSDPLGSGWNIIQSKIAIGSGNLLGRGFLKGTQSHYHFLPEQSTDFIFSILAEETGFFGGILVFSAFFVILIRIIRIIHITSNVYGNFIASGILGMYFYHFIINVGMVMGIMPITGIPLPFLSYGGSALLTNMLAAGLLMSIKSRRLDFSVDII